ALGKPCFVVDAYTRRVLARHRVVDSRASYDQVQALFEQSLPRDARLYGEYHALLVRLAKTYCRTRPRCSSCPLTAPAGPGQKVLS
ncbi:MAG: hypothetical protein ABIK62_05015, partial [candidate division WOR-3 bacterium]